MPMTWHGCWCTDATHAANCRALGIVAERKIIRVCACVCVCVCACACLKGV